MRISDILKKSRRPQPAAAPPRRPPPAPVPEQTAATSEPSAEQPAMPAAPTEPSIPAPADREAALQLYQQALAAVRPLMTPYASDAYLQQAREKVELLMAQLNAGGETLRALFFDQYPADGHYLAHHAVNVCILSLSLGRALAYDTASLKKLGIAALIHDIGLAKYEDIISRSGQISERDIGEIRKHPLVGKDLAAKLGAGVEFEVFDVIQQEHERLDGSGYPFGLKGAEISEFAKLVAVADVYEALTHERPYRPRYGGCEALRRLLAQKQLFSRQALKALIDIMGVFPVGTRVELNTRETGVVVRQTSTMPLRPVVLVTHNAQRQKLAEQKRVDLAKNFSVYVKECAAL